jgi:hypothetical protein
MKPCASCGYSAFDAAQECPSCGRPFSVKTAPADPAAETARFQLASLETAAAALPRRAASPPAPPRPASQPARPASPPPKSSLPPPPPVATLVPEASPGPGPSLLGDIHLPAPESAPSSAEPVRSDGRLRLASVVLGLLLIGFLFAPVGRDESFVWDILRAAPLSATAFLRWLYPAAMGTLLVIFAFAPLPARFRAAASALLALVPLVFFLVEAADLFGDGRAAAALGVSEANLAGAGDGVPWRLQIFAIVLVLQPFALFVRARSRASVLARVLVGVGIAGLLAIFLYPLGGLERENALPLVALLGAGASLGYVASAILVCPFVFALLSLGAFAPSRSGGGLIVGNLFLAWIPLFAVAYVLQGAHPGAWAENPVEVVRILAFAFVCQFFLVHGLTSFLGGRIAGKGPAAASRLRS